MSTELDTIQGVPEDDEANFNFDSADELIRGALDWLQTSVLRLIVTRLIPLILGTGIVTAVLAWLQDAVGLNLPPAAVATFMGTVMAGAVGVAFTYVRNHGQGAAALTATLLNLMNGGKHLLETGAPTPEVTTVSGADRAAEIDAAAVGKTDDGEPPTPTAPPGLTALPSQP